MAIILHDGIAILVFYFGAILNFSKSQLILTLCCLCITCSMALSHGEGSFVLSTCKEIFHQHHSIIKTILKKNWTQSPHYFRNQFVTLTWTLEKSRVQLGVSILSPFLVFVNILKTNQIDSSITHSNIRYINSRNKDYCRKGYNPCPSHLLIFSPCNTIHFICKTKYFTLGTKSIGSITRDYFG